jgi:hypothetical protein
MKENKSISFADKKKLVKKLNPRRNSDQIQIKSSLILLKKIIERVKKLTILLHFYKEGIYFILNIYNSLDL